MLRTAPVASIGLLILAACTPLEPHEQRILDACGTLERDYTRSVQAAERGDLAAIDCEIAVADGVFMGPDDDPPNAITSVSYRIFAGSSQVNSPQTSQNWPGFWTSKPSKPISR